MICMGEVGKRKELSELQKLLDKKSKGGKFEEKKDFWTKCPKAEKLNKTIIW